MSGETARKTVDDLVSDLVAGRRRFHDLPPDLSADEAASVRRRAVEELNDVDLRHIGDYSLDAERASTRHCENFIGAAQVPLGVVGPLRVRGIEVDREVAVPLATTEGALLASVNRGCRAVCRAGGAVVRVEDVGITRAPVFRTSGVEETASLLDWVAAHEDDIRRAAEKTSRYLHLLDIKASAIGTTVFLRFRFRTGDAMGMNMATIACDHIVREVITPATGVPCIALSGNFCVDKKPAAVNFLEGRGKRIQAEALLPREVVESILKSTAEELLEVQYRKNLIGSIAAGAMGNNSHTANVLAALFVATGQDLAHVVEGSMAVVTIEQRDAGAVLFSVMIPALPVGVVGGGTGLATQAEGLALLGVEVDPLRPGAAAMQFAEIAGATVLAGEISLMSALASGDLARAHERLGRAGPDRH